MKAKYLLCFFFAAFLFAMPLVAQGEPAPTDSANADVITDERLLAKLTDIVEDVAQSLIIGQSAQSDENNEKATIYITTVTNREQHTFLSNVLRPMLTSRLLERLGDEIMIVERPSAAVTYTIKGELFVLDNTIVLTIQTVDNTNWRIVFSKEYRLVLNRESQSLIQVMNIDGSSGNTVYADFYENNDTGDYASMIEAGEQIADLTLTNNDRDWFLIDCGDLDFEQKSYALTVTTQSNLDTVIYVYNNLDTDYITYNDDGGTDSNAYVTINCSAEQNRFWVEVSGYSNDIIGEYTLITTLEEIVYDSERDIDEPANNLLSGVSMLSTDTPVIATEARFYPSGDKDFYRLNFAEFAAAQEETPENGQEPASLVIETDSDVDTYIIIYDQHGNNIEEDDDSGESYNAQLILEWPPTTDEYIDIEIYELGDSFGDYTLLIYTE